MLLGGRGNGCWSLGAGWTMGSCLLCVSELGTLYSRGTDGRRQRRSEGDLAHMLLFRAGGAGLCPGRSQARGGIGSCRTLSTYPSALVDHRRPSTQ